MQFNEVNLGKRVLYAESKLFNRKWYAFSRMIEVADEPEVVAAKDDKKAAKKDVKKPGKKDEKKDPNEGLAAAVAGEVLKPKTIKKMIREIFET